MMPGERIGVWPPVTRMVFLAGARTIGSTIATRLGTVAAGAKLQGVVVLLITPKT